jgi:hypothetical protein
LPETGRAGAVFLTERNQSEEAPFPPEDLQVIKPADYSKIRVEIHS